MQITLTISSSIIINPLSRAVAEAVRPLLTMPNPQYAAALRRGYSVRGMPREIRCYNQSPNQLKVPRGFLSPLLNLLGDMGIRPEIKDLRQSLPPLGLRFRGDLRGYQEPSVDSLLQYDSAVLSAPTGSGKTVIALAAIAFRDQPFAVVVHTRELLDQWVAQAEKFLGIRPGVVAAGKFRPGREGTIALVQTLYKDPGRLAKRIGLLVVDECFPYDTKIKTNQGDISIGEIVNKKLQVKILTFNLGSNALEYKSVSRYIKHQLGGSLIRIKHQFGELVCTPNHKLWTKERGYVRADQSAGKTLLFLQDQTSKKTP